MCTSEDKYNSCLLGYWACIIGIVFFLVVFIISLAIRHFLIIAVLLFYANWFRVSLRSWTGGCNS